MKIKGLRYEREKRENGRCRNGGKGREIREDKGYVRWERREERDRKDWGVLGNGRIKRRGESRLGVRRGEGLREEEEEEGGERTREKRRR